ncbi:peroxiredoxin [Kineosporia sp. R_H_3]|uniref:peroxiredoxin family protein n=1 Tax=Kineosporia sp. R_H_3 TaxID=1961848 RepID=UPI000B4C207B|nr:peroxiredoxin family protein [Kineosporia sp. R_H_3]
MTSGSATKRNEEHRQAVLAHAKKADRRGQRRTRLLRAAAGLAVLAVLAAVVTAMMLTSRPTSTTSTRTAPDFTLTDTTGRQVHLGDFRGRPVVLYFSEGAGCGSCLQQMTGIEKEKAAFDAAGVTVLPIVMNTREQITADMATYGATTPFLLDDGTVSKAYGTLGKGMHAGLPGHSFFLIDAAGVQRWSGEYPSMWLAPSDLLGQIRSHLA